MKSRKRILRRNPESKGKKKEKNKDFKKNLEAKGKKKEKKQRNTKKESNPGGLICIIMLNQACKGFFNVHYAHIKRFNLTISVGLKPYRALT